MKIFFIVLITSILTASLFSFLSKTGNFDTDPNTGLKPSPVISGFTCPNVGVTVTKVAQHCSLITDSLNTTKLYVNSVLVLPEPVGSIEEFGGSSILSSSGWLLCDGSAVSRTTYANLFSVISTTYGAGNGSTTFNLPDFRQRFALGLSSSGTGSTLGGTGGQIDHTHTVDPPNTTTSSPSATVAATILAGGAASTTHTHDVNISVFNSGSNNAPFLTVNYIIKY